MRHRPGIRWKEMGNVIENSEIDAVKWRRKQLQRRAAKVLWGPSSEKCLTFINSSYLAIYDLLNCLLNFYEIKFLQKCFYAWSSKWAKIKLPNCTL